MGSRPAFVRVVARRHALALCRNEDGFGRLVVVARRRRCAGHRALEGLAHRARLGRARASRASAPAGAPRRSSPCSIPRRWTRDVAAPRCAGGARRGRPPRTRRRSRGPATDGATVHGLLWLPPEPPVTPAAIPPLLVDVHGGPTDQSTVDWKPRVRWFVVARVGGAEPELPRVRPGYGRAYRQALDHAVGRRRRRRHRGRDPCRSASEDWVDATRAAVMGGSAGGFTALLVAAHAPAVVRGGGEPVRRHRPLRPRRDDAPVRVALPRPSRRHAARARRPLPRRARRSRTRREIAVPVLVLQGADDKVVPPAQAQRSSTRCAPPAATVEHHVYEGEGHGLLPGSHDRRLARAHRRVPHPMGGATMTARRRSSSRSTSGRARSAVPTARCCSRTAPAPTCTAPRCARWPTRSRRRRSRRCGSTTPTAAAGRNAPDRPTVLDAATREAAGRAGEAHEAPARPARAGRPVDGRPLLLDGRRRRRRPGARARPADARRIRCTPPGKPEQPRVEHFPRIRVPVLFVERHPRLDGRQGRAHEGTRRRSGARSRSTGSTPPTTATGP